MAHLHALLAAESSAAPLFTKGPGPARLLFDARPLRFEAIEAPY